MGTIGILCERVRVEEKQLIEALSLVSLHAVPVPPFAMPIALDPATPEPGCFGDYEIIIDRCPDRSAGSHLMSLAQDSDTRILGAGLASRGNRLDVARALVASGVPRPLTYLATSEEAGIHALRTTAYPATLFPLSLGKPGQPIVDQDIAEAVLEHRHTLLSASSRSILVQAGSPAAGATVDLMVVEGRAVACSSTAKAWFRFSASTTLAEAAAEALGAEVIGIRVALHEGRVVVWDVDPVPDFRAMSPLGEASVPDAIAQLVQRRLAGDGVVSLHLDGASLLAQSPEGMRDAVFTH